MSASHAPAVLDVVPADPPQVSPPTPGPRLGRLALVAMVGLAIWSLPLPDGVDPRAWHLLAVFVATVVGIVAKPLPMGAMAAVGIAAALLTRTLTLGEALSGFGTPTVWLVVAAFCFAAGFIKTGFGARIAYRLMTVFGRSTMGLGYSLVATDFILASAVPSNAARAGGVIFPILKSIQKTPVGVDPVKARQTNAFLSLMVYQGTVVTSATLLTGSVSNPLGAQLASSQGVTITWSIWALAAIVPALVSYAVVPQIVFWLCPPGFIKTPEAPAIAGRALAVMGPMKRSERLMALISSCLLVTWIFGAWLEVDNTAAALMAIAALLLTGVLTWDDIVGEHETWNTLVWFATLVMMATLLGQLGLIKWFSGRVGAAVGGIGLAPAFLGLALTYYYVHYFFASNTAHVSAMYAPFLAVALALGAPPLGAALVLGFLNPLSAAVTHYGNASAPILFGGGYVSLGAWWKVGAIVSVANLCIWFGVGSVWWKVLGLW